MSWLFFIVFGFIVGLLARALLPGRQKLGILWTTALGIAGSLIGGLVAKLVSGGTMEKLQPSGFLGSLVGAFLLLLAYVQITKRRGHRHA